MIKELDRIFNELLQIYRENALDKSNHNLFYERPSKDHVSEQNKKALLEKYNAIKENLTNKYGIVGGGIGLLDNIKNRPNLLFARGIKEKVFNDDINNLEVFDFDYPSFGVNKELINLSFFAVRQVEVPEYINLLNNPITSRLDKEEFLKRNRFIWITHSEISNTIEKYQRCVRALFLKANITDYDSLSSYLSESKFNNTPTKYCIDLIDFKLKDNVKFKKKLILSINQYISKIKAINLPETDEADLLQENELHKKIMDIQSKSTFPLLSYSLIYCFAEKKPNFSHVVFPLWNTYYEPYSYSIKNTDAKEYSLLHGLYTIDNNKVDIDEESLIEFKLVLRQFVEPIVDKEHYKKNKEADIKNILLQSNLNAISSVVIYNETHTDGSHTILDAEKFLKAILLQIRNSVNCNCEKCPICNLYRIYDQQTTAYNEQLRLIMATSDALTKGFIGNSYFSYNFQDVLDYWNENYFSDLKQDKVNEKFLGRGLNDGIANSVLGYSKTKTEKDILLPLGDLGTTAILIILKNIFRNLKKHSRSLITKELHDDYININNGIKEKPIYLLDIRLSGLSKKSELYQDYYKIECVELSNSFINTDADKILEDLNNEFKKSFDQRDMDSGWGLKEMKIFASFLIGYPLYENISEADASLAYSEYNGVKYPRQIIKVEKVKCGNDNCRACINYKCKECIKRKNDCVSCLEEICTTCKDKNANCEECNSAKYHISHEFYVKKPKYATIIRNIEGEPKDITQPYIDKGFMLKDLEDANLQSPAHFILGYKGDNKRPETRKHYNFRVLGEDFNIGLDDILDEQRNIGLEKSLRVLKENFENHWIKALELKEYDIYETDNNGKFWNVQSGESKEVDSLDDKSNIAIIDDHLQLIKKKCEESKCPIEIIDYLKKFPYYEEDCNKCKSRQFYKEKNTPPQYLQLESLNFKIGIWDERIQKYLSETKHNIAKEIKLQELFELKHIYAPKFDLQKAFYPEDDSYANVETQTNSELNLNSLIENLKEKPFKECDYIVIHYSGFEKIVERTEKSDFYSGESNLSKQERISKAYMYLIGKEGLDIKGTNRFLVFTSGKSPATLPSNTLFINFSTLDNLIKNKTKFELTLALSSLRIQRLNIKSGE